jgi:hypothetical protein
MIARVIAARIGRFFTSPRIRDRLAFLEAKERSAGRGVPIARTPYFCPGCPHNTSTKVPEGSARWPASAATTWPVWMDRNTGTFTHMGGEGAAWIGQAPFTDERTSSPTWATAPTFHSGSLAIRAAVAAGVNGITYKILYNDAVAMTGGQPVDGNLTVPQIAAPAASRRRAHVVVVTDGTDRRLRPCGRHAPRRPDPPPRRAGRHPARTARMPRRLGHGLRPDLRRREAPPQEARQDDRPAAPRLHQRGRVRRLRRLRRAIQLPGHPAGGNRVRPQAPDRPVGLQQGLLLRQRLLPELRHHRRRQPAGRGAAWQVGSDAAVRRPASAHLPPTARALTASSSPAWAAPAWSPSAR